MRYGLKVGVTLLAGLAVLASGCVGARSTVRVPACVERIEVIGEHHRASETDLVFSHGLDLPFTRTEITVEHTDGTREHITLLNTNPDLLRLFGAGIVGVLAAGAVGLYAYQVGFGNESVWPVGPTFWALPVGLAGAALALFLVSTGWHPGEDTTVPARCTEVTSSSGASSVAGPAPRPAAPPSAPEQPSSEAPAYEPEAPGPAEPAPAEVPAEEPAPPPAGEPAPGDPEPPQDPA